MNDILAWGLDVVRAAQRVASPALTLAMKAITVLGTEWFFLAAIPVVYWCVDKRRGLRLGLLVFLSAFFNGWLKVLFAQPRPFQLDPSVGFASESSYGLPSGHAQGTATFWGAAAPLFRKPWGLVLALGVPLLVGATRIYLGVHFPTDLFAGWALGAFFVAGDALVGDRIEGFLSRQRPRLKLAAAAAIALAMNAVFMEDTSLAGAFFGFGAGLAYAPTAAPFSVRGSAAKRALRYLFGLATIAIIYFAPKLLLGALGSEPLLRFLRYALLGAWGSLGAPWLFIKLGLAEREDSPAPAPAA
jgi:membrane-associated phospholipid phosphatase